MPHSAFRLSQIRLDALVAQLDAAVLVEDEHRRLHTANAAFCRTFGINAPPEALRGADCAAAAADVAGDFVDPEGFLSGIEAHLAARVPRSGERLVLQDGRTLERDYIPVWGDDVYRGHLWIYRDVSSLADAAREVERSHVELERFIDLLSHEMRSPLATATLAAEQLRGTSLDPQQSELVGMLQAAVDAMADVVGETYDRTLTRLDRAPMALSLASCRVEDAVHAVVAIERGEALRKGLSFDFQAVGTSGLDLWMDRGRFRMLVANLVRNAIRYTQVGGVQLYLTASPAASPGRYRIEVRVIDTGVGIREADQAGIFAPYARGRDALGDGHGLGLFLSRHITEAMGGSLQLMHSSPNGSEFRLCIEAAVATTADAATLGGARVLVVDDDPGMARLLLHILEKNCARGVAVTSVAEARAALAREPVDVALVDFSLAGESVEDLVTTLHGRGVPVVVLSGHDEPAIVARIAAMGVAARLLKPAVVELLVTSLRAAIGSGSPTAPR
jgi:signal transduction histidine kinase/ActR/RegA family two-component response regulator